MRELETLIRILARLPGLGPRSARRLALAFIKKPDTLLAPLQNALAEVAAKIVTCDQCGNIDTVNPCQICRQTTRDQKIICVVEEVGDLWAIERAGNYDGVYHVLGGSLSSLDGIGPEQLNIAPLLRRVTDERDGQQPIKEIILATNLTVEGQATAHYLRDRISHNNVKVTRLAHGVPIGGELDYLDDGTLRAAMKARR